MSRYKIGESEDRREGEALKPVAIQRAPEPGASDAAGLQSSFGNAAVAQSLTQGKGTTPAHGLIADDSSETLEPGQMKKSDFLAQLRGSVTRVTDEVLSGTLASAGSSVAIDQWMAKYTGQSAAQIEQEARKYAPGAKAASDYIGAVTGHVRQSLTEWMQPGESPGGAEGGGSTGGSIIGDAVSAIGSILFKGRDASAGVDADPSAIQSKLGGGQALDGGVRSRMESAFGESFAGVEVHADTKGAGLSSNLNARAFTVGEHIAFRAGEYQPGTMVGDALIAHELAHVLQQRSGKATGSPAHKGASGYGALEEDADQAAVSAVVSAWGGAGKGLANISRNALPSLKSGLRLQRCKVEKKEGQLLEDFAAKFPDAVALIRKSEAAMKMVKAAEAAGAKFGGYAEDGPAKNTWPYHQSGTVYIPKAYTDSFLAMNAFLFELNNAMRAPKFAELNKEAGKGSAGTLTAKDFAYKKVEQEVEGMLALGEVWFKMKTDLGGGTELNKYDSNFYMAEYNDFKAGKKTKDDIVKDVLKRTYPTGKNAGKTVEQYYVDQYNDVSGGK